MRKRFKFVFLLLIVFGISPAWAQPETLTLQQAYQLALKQSEDIGQVMETLNAAQGHFYQSFEVILPKVDYTITRSEQDVREGGSSTSGTDSTNSFRRTTPQQKIVFSQPLFSGFKEIAALQGAGAEKAQRRFEIQRAKELLFVDVAESFYAVLQAQRDVEILQEVHALTGKRKGELEERARLGRSREGEALSAIADIKVIEADLIVAQRLERLAKLLLEYYIGRPLMEKLEDVGTMPISVEIADPLKADSRADVKAAENAKTLADKRVIVAQAGLFPEVTLDGNYYTKRVGAQSGNDWDVLLTINVPVFDRLNTFGDIKVAAANRKTAELEVRKLKRQAALDIFNAQEEYETSRLIEAKLAEAADAMKKNYEMQTEDYSRSLVNNLQVLDVLRLYQNAEQRHNEAHYEMKKNYWRFRASLGEIAEAREK